MKVDLGFVREPCEVVPLDECDPVENFFVGSEDVEDVGGGRGGESVVFGEEGEDGEVSEGELIGSRVTRGWLAKDSIALREMEGREEGGRVERRVEADWREQWNRSWVTSSYSIRKWFEFYNIREMCFVGLVLGNYKTISL